MSETARPLGARKRKRNRPIEENANYFTTRDGTRIFYSIEGSGPPLVFCYGLVCSSLHWTYQIEHFRHTHQCIWFDYRGHQRSEKPKDLKTLTVRSIASDLNELLNELSIEKAVILGHSMGVNVVLDFYRDYPERVTSMVLANGTPRRPFDSLLGTNSTELGFKLLKKAHSLSPTLMTKVWQTINRLPFTKMMIGFGGFNPHLTPKEDIALYLEQIGAMDPIIFLKLVEDYENYDATGWLHAIRVPTLVISGADDKVVPLDLQKLMHQLIPGSKYEEIRYGSHCPQMDMPELVNSKIERFLTESCVES